MYVVFEETPSAPPAAAAIESTSRTRFAPGSSPLLFKSPARAPSPTIVPAVSKKSLNMMEKTASATARKPAPLDQTLNIAPNA